MKQAKASDEEVQTLLQWLQTQDQEKFLHPELRPPAYARVVWGYQVLKDNCTDPAKDYLDWKPGYAPADTDRFRTALERICDMPVSERVFSTVLGIVGEALGPNNRIGPDAK